MDLDSKSFNALAEVGEHFNKLHREFIERAKIKYNGLRTKDGPLLEVVKFSEIETKDKMVIDFGCGIGKLSKLIDFTGYIGVDISQKKIERAKKGQKDETYFLNESITSIVLPRKVDIGYCINTFEAFPEDYLQKAFLIVSDAVKQLVVCIDLKPKEWHETRKTHSWWMNELSYYFEIGEFKEDGKYLMIICNEKKW